jgi:ABC-2 type transport system permease protein
VRAALGTAAALFRRTWVATWRRPVVLTFSFGQPLMWMLFFGFLFHRYRLVEMGETAYLDFLAPGISVMTVLFGASQSGIGWIRDLQTGFLPRLLSTPASPYPILAGKVAADVVRLLLQAAGVLALALALGAHLHPGAGGTAAVGAALLCLALFAAAFACLSCAVALTARAQEAMATFVHLVNMPLLFTSTALVPRRQMPDWLAAVARVNPLTLTADAWRGALLFGQAPPLVATALPLALLAALLFLVAASRMRRAASLY